MQVVRDSRACPRPPSGSVVTIGVYDGVHLGHRALLEQTRHLADERGCATAVVTFDVHPAMVVRPESAPRLLTDLEQKLELLAANAVDLTLVVHFDAERSQESPEAFVQEVLVDCLAARAVVVGHDFHFGHGRRGNVPFLAQLGGELGFDDLGIKLVEDAAHEVVSSTRIRQLLGSGEVGDAARLLGRPHEVRGVVRRGDERGRDLGFPTANVAVPAEIQLPADGIYAGWYTRPDGTRLRAALSLGRRPQFYDAGELLLEAYLLDFDGDLYDEDARVSFVERLRAEQRFDSVDALVAQITRDVADTRRLLA